MPISIKGFIITIVLFVLISFAFSLCTVIYSLKLYFYLKKNNYSRWCDLTTLGKYGSGYSNPKKWIPYLHNELDSDDEVIRRYKDNIKLYYRQAIVSFIGLFIFVIIGGVYLKLKVGV